MSEHTSEDDVERGAHTPSRRSWYDVLEVKRDAKLEDIEAAYKRALRIIDGSSLGGYLMLDPEARENARSDVERAFRVLSNPEERARFDRELDDRGESRSAKGRRSRRRKKREAARRARAERGPTDTSPPRAENDATLPVRPALDDDNCEGTEGDDSSYRSDEGSALATDEGDRLDDEAVTLITSAEAEPILEDDPLELPPTPPAATTPAPRSTPPPMPKKGAKAKPLLRFLSPVDESAPTPVTSSTPPSTAPTTPLPTTPQPTTPQPTTPQPTTPQFSSLTSSELSSEDDEPVQTSQRPWLYSDAGTDGLVTEPRVIEGSGVSEVEDIQLLDGEEEINGAVIRRVREGRGLSLDELAEQTHIRKAYLAAIEDQLLDDLPARVYLRGFMTQIARVLKVNKKQLAEGYMGFVERHRS